MKSTIPFLLVLLLGCGAEPRPRTQSPKPSGPVGGPLSTQLANTLQKGPGHEDAIITFALFGQGAEPSVKALQSTVDAALRKARLGKRWTPGLLVVSTKDELPLDLKALGAEMGPLGAGIEQASHITFVRYVGRTGPAMRHLLAAAVSVTALLNREVVVDLGVRRAYDLQSWQKWVDSPGFLANQVVPSAQKEADGSIVFFSRGMAKLGLPDLELTGVRPETARDRFATFQTLLSKIIERGKAKEGDSIDGVGLGPCRRPAEAIEHRCVAMSSP